MFKKMKAKNTQTPSVDFTPLENLVNFFNSIQLRISEEYSIKLDALTKLTQQYKGIIISNRDSIQDEDLQHYFNLSWQFIAIGVRELKPDVVYNDGLVFLGLIERVQRQYEISESINNILQTLITISKDNILAKIPINITLYNNIADCVTTLIPNLSSKFKCTALKFLEIASLHLDKILKSKVYSTTQNLLYFPTRHLDSSVLAAASKAAWANTVNINDKISWIKNIFCPLMKDKNFSVYQIDQPLLKIHHSNDGILYYFHSTLKNAEEKNLFAQLWIDLLADSETDNRIKEYILLMILHPNQSQFPIDHLEKASLKTLLDVIESHVLAIPIWHDNIRKSRKKCFKHYWLFLIFIRNL